MKRPWAFICAASTTKSETLRRYCRELYELGYVPVCPPLQDGQYPQFGQAHPPDGIFVPPQHRYAATTECLLPGTGTGSRCAAGRTPPTPQGSAERCRQSEVDTDHPKPQTAAAGHPALPPDRRAIGADAKTPAAAGGILPKHRKKSRTRTRQKNQPNQIKRRNAYGSLFGQPRPPGRPPRVCRA